MIDYDAFLRAKVTIAQPKGFDVDPGEVNQLLKPHQVAAVIWAIRLGCAALFMAFGLGKTFVQLEIVRIVRARIGGMAELVRVVTHSESPFFVGPFGFELRKARPLPFVPWKGQLSWFDVPRAAVGLPALEVAHG